jgi:major membrane immunogen (membrane-anchored lipoprotein)
MKSLTVSIVAAMLLVGCGESKDIWEAARKGDIKAVKHHLDADVNAEITSVKFRGETALDWAIAFKETELTDLLRKHGAKTGEELKAAGK